ncbi:MAG: hypothetical protein OEW12_02285 [Deltaproteobacteria bacterium]|nr:hypothetical protein [Deltaproteobacteria bacterium]
MVQRLLTLTLQEEFHDWKENRGRELCWFFDLPTLLVMVFILKRMTLLEAAA